MSFFLGENVLHSIERYRLDNSWAGFWRDGRRVDRFSNLSHHVNMIIGASTIMAALASMCAPGFFPSRSALLAAGAVTGVMETATGIGGPALALVFQHYRASALRSTIALCLAIGEVLSLATFSATGAITASKLVAALFLLPPVIVGAVLSHRMHPHIDARALRISVMSFAIVSGGVMLYRTVLS